MGQDIIEGIYILIKPEHPDFVKDSYITLAEFSQYRRLWYGKMGSIQEQVHKEKYRTKLNGIW